MRRIACVLIILAATARAEFAPPVVDPVATPADVHFDNQGNLLIGATGVTSTPDVYPDAEGGYYLTNYNVMCYISIAPEGSARWYARRWTTYGTLDRPSPYPDEPMPSAWDESSFSIDYFVDFQTAIQDRFGAGVLSAFIINAIAGPAVGVDLMQHLTARAPCARHAIEKFSLTPYFHIMMWREQYKNNGRGDIWDMDVNQSGIPWWRNRAVLENPDWNGDLATNRIELELGRDPLAPAYVQSMILDDSGSLIQVPDHFAWNACAHNLIAKAGDDIVVEAGAGGVAMVTLDGSQSSTDGGDALNYSWESAPNAFGILSGISPTVTLRTGSYSVTLTISDDEYNFATDSLLVTVRDTTPPILSDVPADIVLEQAGPEGTSYTLSLPTAWDLASSVTVSSDAPDVFPAGATVVTFTAVDAPGNSAVGTTTVSVVDTTAPIISNVSGPISVIQSDPAGTPVSVPSPTVSDVADTNPSLTSDAPALFPAGTTIVTFTARDKSGNKSTATVSVTVTVPPPSNGFTAALSAGRVCALESATLSIAPRNSTGVAQTLTISYDSRVSIAGVPSGSTVTLNGSALNLAVTGMLPGTATILVSSGSAAVSLTLDVTVIGSLSGTGSNGQSGNPLVLALGSGNATLNIAWSKGNSSRGRYTIRGPVNSSGTFTNNSASFNFSRAGNYTVTAWGDGNGNGIADAQEQPRTLNVVVVGLDLLLALDTNNIFNLGIDPGLTRMNAKRGRDGNISLILAASVNPSNDGQYVRWSINSTTSMLATGNFASIITDASAKASVGQQLSVRAWIDLNSNGIQDAGEPARAIQINVTR